LKGLLSIVYMENILRNKYLKQIRPYYNKQLIKAITGQRRVGKSFLLRQVSDELQSLHTDANYTITLNILIR